MEVGRRDILRAGVAVAFAGIAQKTMAGGEVRKVSEYGRAPTQEDFDLLLG